MRIILYCTFRLKIFFLKLWTEVISCAERADFSYSLPSVHVLCDCQIITEEERIDWKTKILRVRFRNVILDNVNLYQKNRKLSVVVANHFLSGRIGGTTSQKPLVLSLSNFSGKWRQKYLPSFHLPAIYPKIKSKCRRLPLPFSCDATARIATTVAPLCKSFSLLCDSMKRLCIYVMACGGGVLYDVLHKYFTYVLV